MGGVAMQVSIQAENIIMVVIAATLSKISVSANLIQMIDGQRVACIFLANLNLTMLPNITLQQPYESKRENLFPSRWSTGYTAFTKLQMFIANSFFILELLLLSRKRITVISLRDNCTSYVSLCFENFPSVQSILPTLPINVCLLFESGTCSCSSIKNCLVS